MKVKSSEVNVFLALLVAVLGLWAFLELADEVSEGESMPYDSQVLISLRSADNLSDPIGPLWLEEAMRDISALGSQVVLATLILSVTGFFLLYGKKWHALTVMLITLTGVLLVIGLKSFFLRERPDVVPHLVDVSSQSYPSGHTMMSAVIYLSLASMIAPILPEKKLKIYVISIALFITFLVGVSRLYLGVHFPTDVLSGWAVGLAWAAICWMVFRYMIYKITLTNTEKTYEPT